jgi:NAD(P)-dependent dehydrogenase (short-subunit alcohol dehydrogenase family)
VTGAAQGIGEAAARVFAQSGAAVACVDVQSDRVEGVVAAIEQAGGRALAIPVDISTESGNRQAVARCLDAFGRVNFLFANAAIQVMARLEDSSEAEWHRHYAVNLRGVALGVQAVLPALRAAGGGAIVITASLLGIVGDPDLPAYGAMKGGLRAMCRSLAAAYGPDQIRVNTICPGDVNTSLLQEFFEFQPDGEAARERILKQYPLGRFATPEDIARTALFLASDDAAYITGTDIIVDGGLLARIY